MDLLQRSKEKAQAWLESPVIDAATKSTVESLLKASDNRELVDRFYKDLEFGTGGLRGTMGVGPNCMNRYTVGSATQGLANYLLKSFPGQTIRVAVAHDSRNNSSSFAQIVADVFSGNGIEVHLFPALRPTPLLSFAIRHLHCQSGVVITASHNPKEYNGYKAYWTDGAQLVPPHDANVITEVNAITGFDQISFEGNPSLIHTISPEVENAYYDELLRLIPAREAISRQKDLSIVYSSLHGAGITMVPEALRRLGFTNVHIVAAQQEPNGDFPTVQSPNPEERSAMAMALEEGKRVKADIIMATDPDTDRVGIAIPGPDGDFILLNGNQALSIMLYFIMRNLETDGLPPYIAKTIVTTELIDTMARHYGVECVNTLTGFKYIAELIRSNEGKKRFIAAGEESYGYMVGSFVRDKDAVASCAFFAALAAASRENGQSLHQQLVQVYRDHGYYKEGLINLVRKGAEGAAEIRAMMERYRQNPPAEIGGNRVTRVLDYQSGMEQDLENETTRSLDFPKSDVLQFYTSDGSKISVRPSGTEPKIKFYISVLAPLPSVNDYNKVSADLDARIEAIGKDLNP